MAANDGEIEIDGSEEQKVPKIITNEFINALRPKVLATIRILTDNEDKQVADEISRIFTVAENLQSNLRDEQAKVKHLEQHQIDATGRINDAIKISQKDQDTIILLRKEIVESWKVFDSSQSREVEASERLDELRKKFQSAQLEINQFKVQIDETDSNPLGKHKVTLIQECDRLTGEVKDLQKRIQIQRVYTDETQKKLDDSLAQNQELYRQWDEATNDGMSNQKKAKNLEVALEAKSDQLDEMTTSMNHYKEQSQVRHSRLIHRDQQLKEAREDLEKFRTDKAALVVRLAATEKDFEKCKDGLSNMKFELDQMKKTLSLKEDETRKILLQNEHQLKRAELLMRKISSLERAETKQLADILNLQNEVNTVRIERDSIRKANDNMKRDNDNLLKTVGSLKVEVERRDRKLTFDCLEADYYFVIHFTESIRVIKEEKLQLQENKLFVEKELKQSTEREKKASQTIKNIHSKLETTESEKLYLEESMKEMNDVVKGKNQEIEKGKTQIDEANSQLSHFKHEYSMSVKQLKEVRADFQRCHEKEADIKDRIIKSRHQIEYTTNKLVAKIAETVNLVKNIKRLEKNNRELKRDMERSRAVLKMTHGELKNVRLENKNYKEILRDNDARFVKMNGQMEKLLRERDLIANQMIRRTDENELLEVETTALKTSVERGKASYNERLKDIKLMTNEILNLRSQCNVLKRGLESTSDMRHEILQLHRKLNQERTKAKVYEKEMITPLNVHRWRKLDRFDSKRVDLMRKCQLLQRKALLQSVKITKAEQVIEALNTKLEQCEIEASRRPGIVVHEKLMLTRVNILFLILCFLLCNYLSH